MCDYLSPLYLQPNVERESTKSYFYKDIQTLQRFIFGIYYYVVLSLLPPGPFGP